MSCSRESSSFFKLCRTDRKERLIQKKFQKDRCVVDVHVCVVYLNKVSNACRGSKDNPLVHCDGFLVLVFLDGNVSSKEQQ